MTTTSTKPAETPAKAPKARKPTWRHSGKAFLFVLPTFLVLGVFVYFPIIESFRLSLNRVAPFGGQEIFVGFNQYVRLLSSAQFWGTVKVSVFFMVGTVVFAIGFAVAIAILLSIPLKRFSWYYRTAIFIPVVISSAIAGVLFRLLYNPVVGVFK